MKPSILGVALCLVLSCMAQAKQGNENKAGLFTYKCHLQLEDESEVIRDYRRQPRNDHKNLEKLLLNQQVSLAKGERRTISKVLECVNANSQFMTLQARELDRLTLR